MPKVSYKINSFILFGVLGDLSLRKLIPAWYYLERDNLLDDSLKILGIGRQDLSDSDIELKVKDALNTYVSLEHLESEIVSRLSRRFSYCKCDLSKADSYK